MSQDTPRCSNKNILGMSLWKNIYKISPSSIQKWPLQNERTQGHILGKPVPGTEWWFMPGMCPPILCWKFQGGSCWTAGKGCRSPPMSHEAATHQACSMHQSSSTRSWKSSHSKDLILYVEIWVSAIQYPTTWHYFEIIHCIGLEANTPIRAPLFPVGHFQC